MSSKIVHAYLKALGIKSRWIDAREYIVTDSSFREGKVNWERSDEKIKTLSAFLDQEVLITQGFIAADENAPTKARLYCFDHKKTKEGGATDVIQLVIFGSKIQDPNNCDVDNVLVETLVIHKECGESATTYRNQLPTSTQTLQVRTRTRQSAFRLWIGRGRGRNREC